jgi:hypothetical protein
MWLVCAPVKERHASQDVLQDVGECSIATGGVNREGGQLAKKNLRGAMRRRRRRINRSNPRPPCGGISRVKTHSILLVLYCVMANLLNRNSLQGPTKPVVTDRPVWCLVRSLLACRWDVDERAGRVVRTCAVIVYNLGAVTHFIPYYGTRVFFAAHLLRTYAARSLAARTHAPCSGRHVARASSEMHTLARIVAFLFFCVAYLCDHASLGLVS